MNGNAREMDFDMDVEGGESGRHEHDVLEDITNMESTFYAQGYESGHAHGELHGLFEGRELGKEKAWELWEEVGYYEGWAGLWTSVLGQRLDDQAGGEARKGKGRGKEGRALNHAQILLDLISSFPRSNPNPSPASSNDPPSAATAPAPASELTTATGPSENDANTDTDTGTGTPAPTDLAGLISLIRARYRLLCSSLGTRPRLQTANIVEAAPGSGAGAAAATASPVPAEGVVQGIEGPMKGVDTRQLRF